MSLLGWELIPPVAIGTVTHDIVFQFLELPSITACRRGCGGHQQIAKCSEEVMKDSIVLELQPPSVVSKLLIKLFEICELQEKNFHFFEGFIRPSKKPQFLWLFFLVFI